MNAALEFESPYWLILIVLVLIGAFWRTSPYFIVKTHSHFSAQEDKKNIQDKGRRALEKIRFGLPYFFSFFALLALALALADATRSYQSSVQELKTHRIFISVDSSSSMTWGSDTPPAGFAGCQKNSELYPRIDGACKALRRLIDDVEKFSRKKGPGEEKDKIGIIQFAANSYVISYPTNDYDLLKEKARQMVWRKEGDYGYNQHLGIFTNIHLAVWDMFLMAFERNIKKDAGGTFISGSDLRELAKSLVPGKDFTPPKTLKEKLKKIKEEISDAVLIVITDAYVSQINQTLNAGPYSLRNELKLAAHINLPIYFISTDEFHLEAKKLAVSTGGDFVVIRGGLANMANIVSDILKKRFASRVQIKITRRESYAELFALMALIFISTSLLLKQTISRSLTDV